MIFDQVIAFFASLTLIFSMFMAFCCFVFGGISIVDVMLAHEIKPALKRIRQNLPKFSFRRSKTEEVE